MGMNETSFKENDYYEVTGPGEYDVNIVLCSTRDEVKAREYYDSLVSRRHRVSKDGLMKNPYRLYKTTKQLLSEMSTADL